MKKSNTKSVNEIRHSYYFNELMKDPKKYEIVKNNVSKKEFSNLQNGTQDFFEILEKHPEISLEFRKLEGGSEIPKLGLFIVPNSLCLNSEFWLESVQKRNLQQLDDFGIPHGDNPLMVEVWVCSIDPEHDNLTDHMIYSDLKDVFKSERAPGHVPVQWLEQFTEGQCELFTAASGKQYQIEFSQLKHKYCGHGKLQDVLYRLKMDRKAWQEEKAAKAVNS